MQVTGVLIGSGPSQRSSDLIRAGRIRVVRSLLDTGRVTHTEVIRGEYERTLPEHIPLIPLSEYADSHPYSHFQTQSVPVFLAQRCIPNTNGGLRQDLPIGLMK